MGNEKKDVGKRRIVDLGKLFGIPFECDRSYYQQSGTVRNWQRVSSKQLQRKIILAAVLSRLRKGDCSRNRKNCQ